MTGHNEGMPGVFGHTSAIADVSFTHLADRTGESSSRAASRDSGKLSSNAGRRSREDEASEPGTASSRAGTPQRQISHKQRTRNSGGFLLQPVAGRGESTDNDGNSNASGKRKAQNGHLHVAKRRIADSRLSAESSRAGSPLSREVSLDGANGEPQPRSSRPPSLDPAQLVQMALNLSESRRRQASGSLQVPLPSPRQRRDMPGLSADFGTIRSRRSSGRRSSRLMNDVTSDGGIARGPTDYGIFALPEVTDDEVLTSSLATQSRAEKARRFFELASEYRRLLELLPPLKPDANAPGNYTYASKNTPGSTFPDITRTRSYSNEMHHLGRPFNPLQALRNRRVRVRERRPFVVQPEAWVDPGRVSEWVADVQRATTDSSYRSGSDRVRLPTFGDVDEHDSVAENAPSHRKTDTMTSVYIRPENGWSIEPVELLADTYWTENDDNKLLIENSHGNTIFTPSSLGRISSDKPGGGNLRPSVIEEADLPSDSEASSHRKRKPKGSHRGPKHALKLIKVSRSASVTSLSSNERRAPSALKYDSDGAEENIGPLERHMQAMIAKDERGELSSPELMSPDHWDARRMQLPAIKTDLDDSPRSSFQDSNGRLSVDLPSMHRRARSADGRMDTHHRTRTAPGEISSADSGSSVMPGSDPSPASGIRPSPMERKSRLSRLPIFRSRSKDRENKIERTDFAAVDLDSTRLSPVLSSTESTFPRPSMDSTRPSYISRHKTNESWSSSLHRQGTATTNTTSAGSVKEPASTVGRFFRGSRIGEIVRSEGGRISDKFRSKEAVDSGLATDALSPSDSDGEGTDDEARRARPVTVADDDDMDPSPRTSVDRGRRQPKYYLQNLPSFTSPNKRGSTSRPSSLDSDPITRQQQAQRTAGRSPRFDRLAPPRISLPYDPTDQIVGDGDSRKKSYGFLGTNSAAVSQSSLASSRQIGPRNSLLPKSAYSKLKVDGQRHWSISDRLQPEQASTVNIRDVRRVQALLLSSGIKAREIQRRSLAPREPPLPALICAFQLTNKKAVPVIRKAEYAVAGRLLADSLSSTLSAFESTVADFQHKTSRSLGSELEELQNKATDHLTKLVHDTSDDADAFTVELTTKQPQDVKRVDDAIDSMLRRRRRQFRLLRRIGFGLLEYLVLGLLWWIWFIVVLFKSAKSSIVAAFRFVRWLLWF